MAVNSRADIFFSGGDPVPKAGVVKYLGIKIQATGAYSEELANRLASAASAFGMLKPLWASKVPLHLKIRIYEACVLSRLLYCVGANVYTASQIAVLQSRHVRYLRRLLQLPTTWGSIKQGTQPIKNAEVLRRTRQPHMSALVKHQQALALGHLFRSGKESPQSILTHNQHFAPRQIHGDRRVGVPRKRWFPMVVQDCLYFFSDTDHFSQALDGIQARHPVEALHVLAQDRAVWARLASKIKKSGASPPDLPCFSEEYRSH
eukprot:13900247-Alexandrium_andersonii.AAC.1